MPGLGRISPAPRCCGRGQYALTPFESKIIWSKPTRYLPVRFPGTKFLAVGSNPLHLMRIRQDSQPGAGGFEPLHFGIRSAAVDHGLRPSLGMRCGTTTSIEMHTFQCSRPERRVFANSDSEMQRFGSRVEVASCNRPQASRDSGDSFASRRVARAQENKLQLEPRSESKYPLWLAEGQRLKLGLMLCAPLPHSLRGNRISG
jgi:hypothetical protein